MPERLARRIATYKDSDFAVHFPALMNRSNQYLANSGGGAEGTFGAGLLAGWTAASDLPDFELVTGVSTGALIAPFAFLGPANVQDRANPEIRNSNADIIMARFQTHF